MRITKLCFLIAPLTAGLLASIACQTAKRPATFLPPAQTQPPALKPAAAVPKPIPANVQQPAPPPAPVTAQKPVPKLDPVADIIAQAEKEYQAGRDNYKAGHLDAAKQNFDHAFNLLLGSTLDVYSDERLQQELDRVLEGVNSEDMQALQEGDGVTEQKGEPAPIDEANGVTFPGDTKIKAQAEVEVQATRSDLPLMLTDRVAGYINYFSTRGRGTLEHALIRGGRYQEMIQKILRQEGVPQELIYLAQAESGFHPLAVSRVGARGMWQFMGSRAKGYGLERSWWVDDRQDPEKATRAAAHHLKDLYNQFGDWYLAMAAYNSGPGRVQAAVKRTGYADFWELYRRNVLPKETRNYVPIIIAVTIMTKNLSQYGFDDVSMDEPAKFDSVTINYPVDLRLVAQGVGATQAELQDLNPSLLRLTTPRDGKFELHLPAGTKDQYQTAIAAIPSDKRLWWRYHTVHSGDTLASLSHTYRIPVKSIAQANHLDGNELEADAKVIIPIAPGKHVSDTATYARRITRYRVHSGDTVQSVAENFGISPQMLRRWNGLRGDSLRGRRVLALHLPITPTAESSTSRASKSPKRSKTGETASTVKSGSKPAESSADSAAPEPTVVRHRVKSGETLYSIATYYKTSVDTLKRNNHDVGILRPGMILIVQQAR